MLSFVKVGSRHDLPVGRSKTVWVNGRAIALFNVEGEICATSDGCPHEGVSLGSGGDLEGPVVTCGYHFWSFDVRTGESVDGMDERLQRYRVRLEGDDIFVQAPATPPCVREV